MQAHPAHAHPSSTATTTTSVTGALRAVEAFLLRGGQQTARRNAWTAVLEDRRRAKDRREAQHVLDTLTARRNGGPS
ncbi:hypothetical protein ABZ746_27995 [Streptomyces sp. NPDC020096]|jgi:hypothetical protein